MSHAEFQLNRLLAQFPPTAVESLLDSADVVRLESGRLRVQSQAASSFVHFPLSGLVSMVSIGSDGTMVEAGLTGTEGLFGSIQLPPSEASMVAITQVPGEAVRIPAFTFRDIMVSEPQVGRLVTRFLEYQFAMAAQIAGCNRIHPARGRLARWLALANARTGLKQIPVTHEMAAHLLGLRRPTVTVAAHELFRAGAIRYRWGKVEVLDADRLHSECCDCFWTMQELYNRLFD